MYYEITHPLVKHKLTVLRNNVTLHTQFRELISEITLLLGYEAMRNLEIEPLKVETPLAKAMGSKLNSDIVVIPILRAGMGMMEGMLALVPSARVGFVGIYPDPVTHLAISYAEKLPQGLTNPHYFVIDPMLATGNSMVTAINTLKEKNCTPITVITIISAPEGIKRVEETNPDVDIYTASIDECLDKNNYIVPGLGNVGDRLFGTE